MKKESSLRRPIVGNRDLSRALNRSTVLNMIKTHGPIARADIARRTGLSAATVTGITADLIRDELVYEMEPGDSGGGRRPIPLALNAHGAYVVGIKLTEQQVIGCLTDLEATVLSSQAMPIHSRRWEDVVETLAQFVNTLLQGHQGPRSRLLGVGIGLAGIVEPVHGVLRRSPYFGWTNVPLQQLIADRVHAPVYVDNDVNTLTLAEQWFGAGQEIDNFLVITLGRGIGLGIVVNGQLYRGADGGAGEFGHTVVDPDGPWCECGNRGCLETFVGEPGLVRSARQALQQAGRATEVASADEMVALAQAGDELMQAVFAQAGTLLGMAIARLINVFNPGLIVIGGEGVRLGDLLLQPMRASLARCALPLLLANMDLNVDAWGDDAWARGAASLVLHHLYQSPVHRQLHKPVEAAP